MFSPSPSAGSVCFHKYAKEFCLQVCKENLEQGQEWVRVCERMHVCVGHVFNVLTKWKLVT